MFFREQRDKVRERNLPIIKTYEKLTFKDSKDSDVKRENTLDRVLTLLWVQC